MNGSENDYALSFSIVGDQTVGKSCLRYRFVENVFAEGPEIEKEFLVKRAHLGEMSCRLQLWDNDKKYGPARFEIYDDLLPGVNAKHPLLKGGKHGIMIVYDITSRASFESIPLWLRRIEAQCNESVGVMIVGNKCDLEEKRQVEQSDAKEFAESLRIPFIEVSAKEGFNVDDAFLTMARQRVDRAKTRQGEAEKRKKESGKVESGCKVS